MAEATILISTSPIPSHPSTRIIDETIDSLKQLRLPIVIMADGVREEQEHLTSKYQEYVDKLLTKHHGAEFHISARFVHQAELTKQVINKIKTPLVFYVEHDTPICGDIPLKEMSDTVLSGKADLIRLMHEANILEPHKHLMLETDGDYTKTIQWSQRPHLASTDFYRKILNNFPSDCRTMIEDKMHSVVQSNYDITGKWEEYKLWIYTPKGDMKRSYHLDGRETESKFEMVYE